MVKSKWDKLPSTADVSRVMAFMDTVPFTTWVSAPTWYPEAHMVARFMASMFDCTTAQVSALIALMSPQVEWGRNVRMVWAYLESGQTTGLADYQIDRAYNILASDTPASLIHGPKVTRFDRNIMGDGSCITIDRHMMWCIGEDASNLSEWPYRYWHSVYRLAFDAWLGIPEHATIRDILTRDFEIDYSAVQAGMWRHVQALKGLVTTPYPPLVRAYLDAYLSVTESFTSVVWAA